MMEIETDRLIIRKFTEEDSEALFIILKDEEVNRFLPWYPIKSIEETRKFQKERFANTYAICMKEDNYPIGYIGFDTNPPHDLGYGLRKEFWHKGIATEAGRAVIEQARKAGLEYITATHDRNNPRSGSVMKSLGMRYLYSYEELWKPKNILVTFRLYQLNLDSNENRIYKKYWDQVDQKFIEEGLC